ncbi:LPS translocon maturation chaperone LptM [Polaromonas sp. CG_9.5]|uniref:LPS translocon maturation chaperone LptM n=1 Tax=Polaromonas sp. CG_9.5 TaxID=3071705 RepID=UPI003FA38DEC
MVFSHRILGRLSVLTRRHGLAAAVAGAAVLSGCGQKGPLFLPVPPMAPPLVVMQPSPPPAPAAVTAATAPSSAAR